MSSAALSVDRHEPQIKSRVFTVMWSKKIVYVVVMIALLVLASVYNRESFQTQLPLDTPMYDRYRSILQTETSLLNHSDCIQIHVMQMKDSCVKHSRAYFHSIFTNGKCSLSIACAL